MTLEFILYCLEENICLVNNVQTMNNTKFFPLNVQK